MRAVADGRGVGGDASAGRRADRAAGLQILRAILVHEVTRRRYSASPKSAGAGCVLGKAVGLCGFW